jgi:hypothetical protein
VTTTPVEADSNTIPARFSQLVASPGDRDAAILTCVTVVGAYLGRRSALIHNGHRIYPTLYSLIVAAPSTLADWYWWWSIHFQLPVTKSGISKAESLVHLVRDEVRRPDKVWTERGANPEWRSTLVDEGVAEKRHLIMQRLAPELVSTTRSTARQLGDTLNAGYIDGEMLVYTSYRDGGFHCVKEAHVVLLIPEPDERIAAAVCDQMPFLVARAEHAPLDVDIRDSKVWEVVEDVVDAIESAPSEVNIGYDAARIIQSEIRSNQHTDLTHLRLAHILAVLARSPVVTETLVLQARAIVRASEGTVESLRRGRRVVLGDELLGSMRAAGGSGLSHHKLVRLFRRRRNSLADIQKTLAELLRRQEVTRTVVKTSGRDRVEWNVPRVQ